jgi:hypothetical protein
MEMEALGAVDTALLALLPLQVPRMGDWAPVVAFNLFHASLLWSCAGLERYLPSAGWP